MQELDTEVVVATARGTNTNATAVSANIIVDERQMNALFLDVVSCFILWTMKFVIKVFKPIRQQLTAIIMSNLNYIWYLDSQFPFIRNSSIAIICLVYLKAVAMAYSLSFLFKHFSDQIQRQIISVNYSLTRSKRGLLTYSRVIATFMDLFYGDINLHVISNFSALCRFGWVSHMDCDFRGSLHF